MSARPSYPISLFILIAVAGCLGAAGPGSAPKAALPEIKKDCSLCHPDGGGAPAGRLKKPVSALCLDCHPERRGDREHAVDVVPSMAVAGLPLSEGKITCATCHDSHANRYGKLLRMPAAKLCQACHRK